MVPSQQNHADALGVRTKSEIKRSFESLIPTHAQHAEAL